MPRTLVILRDTHNSDQPTTSTTWDGTAKDKRTINAWRMRWNTRQRGRYALDFTGREVRYERDPQRPANVILVEASTGQPPIL